MTREELQFTIVRTIDDYYTAQDDAEIHLADELRQLEDNYAAGFVSEEEYEEKESQLIREISVAENAASYFHSFLEQYFVDWEDLTGEKVGFESFEHLLK